MVEKFKPGDRVVCRRVVWTGCGGSKSYPQKDMTYTVREVVYFPHHPGTAALRFVEIVNPVKYYERFDLHTESAFSSEAFELS